MAVLVRSKLAVKMGQLSSPGKSINKSPNKSGLRYIKQMLFCLFLQNLAPSIHKSISFNSLHKRKIQFKEKVTLGGKISTFNTIKKRLKHFYFKLDMLRLVNHCY